MRGSIYLNIDRDAYELGNWQYVLDAREVAVYTKMYMLAAEDDSRIALDDLASLVGIGKSTLTIILQKLQNSGLIKGLPDDN